MFRDEQTTAERVQSRLWSFLTCFIGVHLKSGLLVFIALLILYIQEERDEHASLENLNILKQDLLFGTKALRKTRSD